MKWKIVDEVYLDYLRNFETRIPHFNYGNDKYKPFFGTLFERNDLIYITQISHPQPSRHLNMKQQLDFYKIYHPSENRLIAVINLNYMFPIPKNLISNLEYSDIEQLRSFKNDVEKSKYISLMKNELIQLNKLSLDVSAQKIFDLKYNNSYSSLAKRCLNFKELENKAKTYAENSNKITTTVY